jgi:thiol-disulfide isomerase/thioredoxin
MRAHGSSGTFRDDAFSARSNVFFFFTLAPLVLAATRKMEAFLQQIRTSSDRNFLLAVKYSDIFEQVQKRLDLLNEIAETPAPATTTSADHAAAPAENSVVAELPQEHVSLPAIRDGPDHARDGHGAYPASLKAICTEEQLRQVLTANEDKFVVVKLGADWCKPCVKVHRVPRLSCSAA